MIVITLVNPLVIYAGTPWIGDMEYIFLFLVVLLLVLIGSKPAYKLLKGSYKLVLSWWHEVKKDLDPGRG